MLKKQPQSEKKPKKIALCHPWDFNGPSGEKALSLRLELACVKLGVELLQIDVNGYILNKEYQNSGLHISGLDDVNFIFHHHFATKKQCDFRTIFALWNPPTIPYDWPNPHHWINTYSHHDDYLSASDGGGASIDHLNMLLSTQKRSHDNSNYLYSGLPESIYLKPSLENLKKTNKIFYVGMNWERIDNREGRHASLFSLLDHDECMEFYGPEIACGIKTWAGYQCYKGEIPFDYGSSLIKKINTLAIALTLSSSVHQKAGIMTNRIFESAAAGAFIIADKNDFVARHFGDSVIQVENEGDTETTYQQIKQALAWVKKNPDLAHKKATRAQEIYLERFTLEKNLKKILDNVAQREEIVASQIYAQQTKEEIDVIIRWYSPTLEHFENTVKSINRQIYKKIRLIIVCDTKREAAINSILKKNLREGIRYIICPMSIFHQNVLLKRKLLTGELLNHGLKQVENKYLAFIDPLEEWFSDHLTTLKRALEDDSNKVMSYVPSLKHVWRGGVIDHSSRDFEEGLNKTNLIEIRLDNRIGRSMLISAYLKEISKNGFSTLLNFLDQTEFHPITTLLITSDKAAFIPRTTYALNYYAWNPPRYSGNFWAEIIYDLNKQRDVIFSYLQGRVDANFIALMKDTRAIKQNQTTSPQSENQAKVIFPTTVEALLNYSGEEFLQQAYQMILGRSPDPDGFSHYMSKLNKGVQRENIIAAIAASDEAGKKDFVNNIPGLNALKSHYLKNENSLFYKLKNKLHKTLLQEQ